MFNPGDRVKIVEWAVTNEGPYASKDRRQLVGRTGTVVQSADDYVSVRLDDDPAYVHATVLAIPSELEHYVDQDEAQSA
jgi:hypothetical protein